MQSAHEWQELALFASRADQERSLKHGRHHLVRCCRHCLTSRITTGNPTTTASAEQYTVALDINESTHRRTQPNGWLRARRTTTTADRLSRSAGNATASYRFHGQPGSARWLQWATPSHASYAYRISKSGLCWWSSGTANWASSATNRYTRTMGLRKRTSRWVTEPRCVQATTHAAAWP